MEDLVANLAMLGRVQLMPGILPVAVENPSVQCLVSHCFPARLEDSSRGVTVDTTDCTVFTIRHKGRGDVDLAQAVNAQQVFEHSLAAVTEATIWSKANEDVGTISSFMRQAGTVDVKAFFAECNGNQLIGWINPAFTFDRGSAALVAQLMSNMIVTNGPSASPVPAITRRVMSSLDLINLGFYTESFVNFFSLVDDLTQEVVKAGMTIRGLTDEQQKSMLRAVKEERLKVYLCNLAKLCGWQSLEEADSELFKLVQGVNTTRNSIMHGSRRLMRQDAISANAILLRLIGWLRSNPFGFAIPVFPTLQEAQPVFTLLPVFNSQPGNS